MQNRSAKNTAPAVSDSFVMHNRTVFVKVGKRLSAASTPKIHFAENAKAEFVAKTAHIQDMIAKDTGAEIMDLLAAAKG